MKQECVGFVNFLMLDHDNFHRNQNQSDRAHLPSPRQVKKKTTPKKNVLGFTNVSVGRQPKKNAPPDAIQSPANQANPNLPEH